MLTLELCECRLSYKKEQFKCALVLTEAKPGDAAIVKVRCAIGRLYVQPLEKSQINTNVR